MPFTKHPMRKLIFISLKISHKAAVIIISGHLFSLSYANRRTKEKDKENTLAACLPHHINPTSTVKTNSAG